MSDVPTFSDPDFPEEQPGTAEFVSGLDVPDLAECVRGWRSFNVDPEAEEPRLLSLNMFDGWVPFQAAEARCTSCEDVPGERCTCGFYSAHSIDHLMSMNYHSYNVETGQIKVLAEVANWGKVRRGSQGWRSAKAYPIRIYVPFETYKLAARLRRTYGVPTKLLNFLQSYSKIKDQL